MEHGSCKLLWLSCVLLATMVMGTRSQSDPCNDSTIRLQTFQNEGYIEVCHEEVWGRLQVCGGSWGANEAAVVCRELGYVPWGASVNLTASSGGGYVVDSSCNGIESSFHGCQTTFEHNCSQPQDVWISCTEAGTCTEGEVRLVGGETNLEGQVQVCLEGGWGTVCSTTYWNDKATAVVCRQLGFSPYGASTTSFNGTLEGGFIIVENECSGMEEQLTDCRTVTYIRSQCLKRLGTAGVTCQDQEASSCNQCSLSSSKFCSASLSIPLPVATSSWSRTEDVATEPVPSPSATMDSSKPKYTTAGVSIEPSPGSPQASSQMPLLAAFLGGCGVLLLTAVVICAVSIAILVKARKHRQHVHTTSGDANAKAGTFHNAIYGASGATAGNGLSADLDSELADEIELMNPLYSIPTSPATNQVPYSHIYADRISTAGIIDTAVNVQATNGNEGPAPDLKFPGLVTKEGAYSQLDLAGPNQYATLEPFIIGKLEEGDGNMPTEGYSHLQHS